MFSSWPVLTAGAKLQSMTRFCTPVKEFAGEATVDMLRSELTIPNYIAWDSACPSNCNRFNCPLGVGTRLQYIWMPSLWTGADRRELGYILSLGSLGEAWKHVCFGEFWHVSLPNAIEPAALTLESSMQFLLEFGSSTLCSSAAVVWHRRCSVGPWPPCAQRPSRGKSFSEAADLCLLCFCRE